MLADELYGYDFDELKVGMSAVESRTVTETDLRNFSGVSGDINPMHLNEEFAQKTMFKGCIVHGMLTAALISAAIGNRLPGPGCIYINQTLRFKAPVRVGDTVYAKVIIRELVPEKRRVKLSTTCYVGDNIVLDGEAEVMIPER
jgi:3-hydroxybutyryl-CoA dehydratase